MPVGGSLSTSILALLCLAHQGSAGGMLSFLSLYNYSTVDTGDETHSGAVSPRETFKFGDNEIDKVYVSTNGYFSLGKAPSVASLENFSGSTSYSVIAPFAADIVTTKNAGVVRFTQFTNTDSQMNTVSTFIQSQTDSHDFEGSEMMVAEWYRVHLYGGSTSITNTFQGILINDNSKYFAVFIYECHYMEWGGGVIGWQASTSQYNTHYLSGDSNSNNIGCLYFNTYSAVVFELYNGCDSSEFQCYNGNCEYKSEKCDGNDDCGDGSDEENCSCGSDEFTCNNGECVEESDHCDGFDDCTDDSDEDGCDTVALAVGITAGVIVLLLIIGIPICIVIAVCYTNSRKKYQPLQTHVVAATGANVNQTPTVNPVILVQEPCDRLISHDVPPCYAATAQQPPPQNQHHPLQHVPYQHQPPHGQPRHGQPHHGQPRHGQPHHGQPPHGQPPHGQPSPNVQAGRNRRGGNENVHAGILFS